MAKRNNGGREVLRGRLGGLGGLKLLKITAVNVFPSSHSEFQMEDYVS